MTSRERLHNWSGAYVLDALDRHERDVFADAIAEWDDMRDEVIELSDTAAALGLALPPLDPRPELRDRVLALAAATPQHPSEPMPMATPMTGARHRVRRRWTPALRRGPLMLAAAAVAVALAVGPVLAAILPPSDRAVIAALRDAPGTTRSSALLPDGSQVAVLADAETGEAALVWTSLPPLPSNRTYELWLVGSSTREAGLVAADDLHEGSVLVEGRPRPGDALALTVEPPGGSEQPTTAPLFVLPVA